MTGKRRRQTAVREILLNSFGSTHEQIKADLEKLGIIASQSTLSRDLREMGAVKVPVEGKGAMYRLGGSFSLDEIGNAIKTFVIEYESVGNFLVIRTAPGNAQGFCVILDRQHWPEIVGTVAGDDTILVIGRTARDIAHVENNLKQSTGKGIS